MEKVTQSKRIIEKYTMTCLEVKTLELKDKIPNITLEDTFDYLENVVLDGKQLKNTNDAAYYVLNISPEDMIEYIDSSEYHKRTK